MRTIAVFDLLSVFLVFFILSFLLTTLLPILNRNLLIPITIVFIGFYLIFGKNFQPPQSDIGVIRQLESQVEKALGFNVVHLGYWFILFLAWLLIAGLAALVFELFMRDKSDEIFKNVESFFNLFGARNILLISCFIIPFVIFAAMYFRFMTSRTMFLCVLCFTTAQLEVIYSSVKKHTAIVGNKNIFLLSATAFVNVFLLLLALGILLAVRTR